MDDMPVSSNTNKALQEIRDLPVALLKPASDVLIPADHAPTAAFWAQYNDEERSIEMQACLLKGTQMAVTQNAKGLLDLLFTRFWGVERFSCFKRSIMRRGYSKVFTGRL